MKKTLLSFLALALSLSLFVACNDEEIGKLEETTTAIDAELTELKSLVDQIKTTADAAATAQKLTEVADKLRNVDINTLTPIEAMNLLFELKKILAD